MSTFEKIRMVPSAMSRAVVLVRSHAAALDLAIAFETNEAGVGHGLIRRRDEFFELIDREVQF